MDGYLTAIVALLAVSAVLRLVGVRATERLDPGPSACGYLAAGPRRAVLVALVVLRRRSAVGIGGSGLVRCTGTLGPTDDPVERAVYTALNLPLGPRAIYARKGVQEALAVTGKRLVAAGLLLPAWRWVIIRLVPPAVVSLAVLNILSGDVEWSVAGGGALLAAGSLLLSRRTRAGRRLLTGLREQLVFPEKPLPPEETGMAVAVHGRLDLPGISAFARRAGLRDGGQWSQPFPSSPHRGSGWGIAGSADTGGGGGEGGN